MTGPSWQMRLYLAVLCLALFAAPVLGQDAEPAGEALVEGTYILERDYLASYPENAGRILISPLLFDRDDWIMVGLAVGVTGALIGLDGPVRDFWQDEVRGSGTDATSDVFRQFGDLSNLAIGSLGAYAIAELFDARREKAASLLALESVVLSTTLITGLKVLTGRERPDDENGAFAFKGLPGGGVDDSFPSGHSGRAFAVAAVVSDIYGPDNPWVPWITYSVAAGTALSRINDDRHWSSDVFVGGLLGTLVGKMVVQSNPFLARNGMALRPFHQQGASGVSLAVRF